MFTVKPYFSDSFVCKADKCSDTCCAGWEIDIDSETLSKYKNLQSCHYEKLMQGICSDNGVYSFRLKDNERCWFLAENGLCDIYSCLGKDNLCEICREHPRFYNYYDNAVEMGYGLCCEKVCELLSEDDDDFSLLIEGELPDDDYAQLFRLRNECFEIISDKNDDFSCKINSLLRFASEVQYEYFGDKFIFREKTDKKAIFDDVIELYSETEPINSFWSSILSVLSDNIDRIAVESDKMGICDIFCEKILSYILYRHLIENAFCGDFFAGICFAVAGVIFIHMLDCLTLSTNGQLSMSDRIDNVKLWSKQVEYSQENTDLLSVESVRLFVDKEYI